MPRGERRTKKEILIAQIESKDAKIDFFEIKIDKLTQEKAELQGQLDYLIESEARAEAEAKDKELLDILKKYDITKEQLEYMINHQ